MTVWMSRLSSYVGALSRHVRLPGYLRGFKPIKSIRFVWLRACKDAGLTGKIPHDSRRTAVRNMVQAGIPERVAMELSGHRTTEGRE